MLGVVGVAPAGDFAPTSGPSAAYGGNMDFNEIREGATLSLPVFHPGALLFMGDGHALMADGEPSGAGLETSMDVELTVDVIPGKWIRGPRVESATHIMAMGLGGSLEDAMRGATGSMAAWLNEDYKLTPSEVAQVLGTSAEYRISEVADRNAGIVLKISKERLKGLAPASK
jgi:acetamidase/formamidase